MIFAAASSSLSSSDRALMAACRVIAAETGENSCALYSARKAGFVSVAAHVEAKRAAADAVAAVKRAARRAAAVPAVALNVCVCRDLATAFLVSNADALEMFDASDLRGDVLYRRGTDGRVTRVLW